ncbi:MAG TPA: biopolymer transporter ExbD [Lacibacter sp.]|nr:biopolymer transporter ExbD [Lacibacter sp.]HMO88909.1 biopolymer transporter ExbD [Lacibacter sp.]HMP87991.1 biopolymer transporter ExbD [Lacibacter sp.]
MGADVDSGSQDHGKKGPGVKKQKKVPVRVDMTPMVDLGFLLITFFIFTTTMSSPKAFNLKVPDDTAKQEEQTEAKASGAFTVLLSKENRIFYYEGQLQSDGSNFKSTNFKEFRSVLLDKKARTPEKDLVVIIKPNEEAEYKNLVDVLDEMTICEIKRYAMVEISQGEKDLISVSEGASGK